MLTSFLFLAEFAFVSFRRELHQLSGAGPIHHYSQRTNKHIVHMRSSTPKISA